MDSVSRVAQWLSQFGIDYGDSWRLRAAVLLRSLYLNALANRMWDRDTGRFLESHHDAAFHETELVVVRGGRGFTRRFSHDGLLSTLCFLQPVVDFTKRVWSERAECQVVELLRSGEDAEILLFNPATFYMDSTEPYWGLLYLDLDHVDVLPEHLLSCPPDVFDCAERKFSPVWERLYQAYEGDGIVLSLLYYDALWYHTGQHIHVVFRGHWKEQLPFAEALRTRLRSDPQQVFHSRMKVRLAGSVNPKNGELVLGYFHPFAFPKRYPFVPAYRDELLYTTDRPAAPEPVVPTSWSVGSKPVRSDGAGEVDLIAQIQRRMWERVMSARPARVGFGVMSDAQQSLQSDGDDGELVERWHWQIEFQAEPFGRRVLQELGVDGGWSEQVDPDGRMFVQHLYTAGPPSWLKRVERGWTKRDFKAFRVFVQRQVLSSRVASRYPLCELEKLERALGVSVLLELEWGVARHLRSANRTADLLAFVWLNHLKRKDYTHGIIPREVAESFLAEKLGWSVSNVRYRLRRLLKLGWLVPKRCGYLVHSWAKLATKLEVPCEKLLLVSENELKDVKSLKSVLASVLGTRKQPFIKYEIAKQLGVHPNTVKRNRKGRLKAWNTVRFPLVFSSFEEAEKARMEQVKHPVHGWPLWLCGYRMRPKRSKRKEWYLLRSGAAWVLDLVMVYRSGKSKRLRKLTNHLAVTGSGIGSSGVQTFVPYDESRRSNFALSPLLVEKEPRHGEQLQVVAVEAPLTEWERRRLQQEQLEEEIEREMFLCYKERDVYDEEERDLYEEDDFSDD